MQKKIQKLIVIFEILIIFLSIYQRVFAQGFIPKYNDSINFCGIGIYLAPKKIVIYSEPDEKSRIIEQIQWNSLGVSNATDDLNSKRIFISFIPDKNVAVMSVVDDIDGWCRVIYNQRSGASGWVEIDNSDRFMTWFEFMDKYGRDKGLRLFADLPDKKIYTSPDEKAQVQNCYNYCPDNVKLEFIRGNWMLVKVIDYSKTNTYIGWIKWRNDMGKIFAFPDFFNE